LWNAGFLVFRYSGILVLFYAPLTGETGVIGQDLEPGSRFDTEPANQQILRSAQDKPANQQILRSAQDKPADPSLRSGQASRSLAPLGTSQLNQNTSSPVHQFTK
jgi:hypothetical protein